MLTGLDSNKKCVLLFLHSYILISAFSIYFYLCVCTTMYCVSVHVHVRVTVSVSVSLFLLPYLCACKCLWYSEDGVGPDGGGVTAICEQPDVDTANQTRVCKRSKCS